MVACFKLAASPPAFCHRESHSIMRPAVFCALLAVLSAVLFAPEVLGYGEQCVLYVAEDGIDRGDCRNANVPCRTLIDALDCASKGDKTALPPEATCSIQRSCGGRAAAQ
jgi:hypothetical protein